MRSKNPLSVNKVLAFLCLTCVAVTVLGLPTILDAATEKLTVYVVNYPLKYFAERIAGDHAAVVFPAPAEVDPAYWGNLAMVAC